MKGRLTEAKQARSRVDRVQVAEIPAFKKSGRRAPASSRGQEA